MVSLSPSGQWPRRAWLTSTARYLMLLAGSPRLPKRVSQKRVAQSKAVDGMTMARIDKHASLHDPQRWQALAHQALDAAVSAGARYADVRLTRTVGHRYLFGGYNAWFDADVELTAVGVRALVNGYWGFASCPWHEPDAVIQIARDAVAQATTNAKGPSRVVELGTVPIVTGTWSTPMKMDPFQISIEEKCDTLRVLMDDAGRYDIRFPDFPNISILEFHRQERLTATSEGTLVSQAVYESGGDFIVRYADENPFNPQLPALVLKGLDVAGKGWEILEDAKLHEQFVSAVDQIQKNAALSRQQKGATVGKYTVVCDGRTMAALLESTLGVATQLDRALGYEANAGGTSFITDPLQMVGHAQIAAPTVTITANRSAPQQLATVKWDDEGVAPVPFTLVKNGVLTDFQTTREQAAWLAPYYRQIGRSVQSNGCAGCEDALGIPLQMMPNLALESAPASLRLEDLIADVAHGILITDGEVTEIDFQSRNGLLQGKGGGAGTMREIKNGKIGKPLVGGAVSFNAPELWTNVMALGGSETVDTIAVHRNSGVIGNGDFMYGERGWRPHKGQPRQTTGYSVQSGAAVIKDQPLIDPTRKG